MKKEFAQTLVDTLRSDKYQQTRFAFKRIEEGRGECFCVAGVIADLCGAEWEPRIMYASTTDQFKIVGNPGLATLPDNILAWIGSTNDEIDELVMKNDTSEETFAQLADFIEAKYITT